jgi:hypothetical protein
MENAACGHRTQERIYPSLSVGSGGSIYIAYLRGDYNNADLRLATHAPTSQDAMTIFSGIFIIGGTPSLVVDTQGTPHVAFVMGTLDWGSPGP